MKCVVPGQNVKIIARAIHSLSKIGDELFIEPAADALVFRTVNLSQSAYVEFKMHTTFFSSFLFDADTDSDIKCKVATKSCLGIFKATHSLDKQVEQCEIRMKASKNAVVFLVKFLNLSIKKCFVPIIDSERLKADIPSCAPNKVIVGSKFLSVALRNIRNSEDEITFGANKEEAMIKNHIEARDMNLLRTELKFHPNDFDCYEVKEPTSITFCFREFRAVLGFAEPANLPIIILFEKPGYPVIFQVINSPAYEVSYVVSTLNANHSVADTSLHTSRVFRPSREAVERPPSSQYSFTNEPSTSDPPFALPNRSLKRKEAPVSRTPPDSPTDMTQGAQEIDDILNSSKRRRKLAENEIADAARTVVEQSVDVTLSQNPNVSLTSLPPLNCSAAFHERNELAFSLRLGEGKEQPVKYSETAKSLIMKVFGRCFNGISFCYTLPRDDDVLADDSDS